VVATPTGEVVGPLIWATAVAARITQEKAKSPIGFKMESFLGDFNGITEMA
jgi:hypothetical protein